MHQSKTAFHGLRGASSSNPHEGNPSGLGKGNSAHALQPGRAHFRAPSSPACYFPDPRRNRRILTCSGPVKFPDPRLQPLGCKSGNTMTLQGFPDERVEQGAKKFPASRRTGSPAADRERDDFEPNRLARAGNRFGLGRGMIAAEGGGFGAFTPESSANSGCAPPSNHPILVKRRQNSNHIPAIERQHFGREGPEPRQREVRNRWTRRAARP